MDMRSISVAASSFGACGRTSAARPGMSPSVTRSRTAAFSDFSTTVQEPKSTALRYSIDDSNAERATTRPSTAVIDRATGMPAASARSQ